MSSNTQTSSRPGASSSRPDGPSLPVDTWVLVNNGKYSKAGATLPKRDDTKKYNHIICIDGTSNNQLHDRKAVNEGQVTNVGRISHLFPSVTRDGTVQQVLYQPGIGSVSDYSTPALRLIDNMIDQGIGGDFDKHIISLYRYLSIGYRPGDQIFIFGFSRGAYIARVLSSLIADVGIFNRKQQKATQGECTTIITDILNQWKLQKGGKPTDKTYTAYMQPAKIDFLGLFDTVAALGLPDFANVDMQCQEYRFAEQIANRPLIRRTFQAIALSERRENFKCLLFTKRHEKQIINQVWFPGFHESIGGGNGDPGNTVPYVTLIWMISKFRSLVEINQTKLRQYIAPSSGHIPCDDVADSRSGMWLANTIEYRSTSLGSGVNEKRHIITQQPYFTQYTGIPEMPDVDGSEQKPIQLKKIGMEKPDEWEQSMLNLLENHVDGVRGFFESKMHHLVHHTMHGISHAPIITPNGPYEGSDSGSSNAAVSGGVQRCTTVQTTKTQKAAAASVGSATVTKTQTTQTVKTQQTATKGSSRSEKKVIAASAESVTVKTQEKKEAVEPVRRVQTGLRQAGTGKQQPGYDKKQAEGMMRRMQTLPVREGKTTQGSDEISTQVKVVKKVRVAVSNGA
ncbi:hypothetical protein QBC38DRAFT_541832 [Podospora fimiseda]|uniref:T6SS Phospholipase effector Tle1-like catalytic domain-containing protein n=1 Tax=Podospora fimiseda TaxID=252190 RepID=A0AAN7BXJ5_9PEZI|nr:hypothetical protein QBC38DRAFT_541832 [Podospora fimiseda]